jgi:hypothetical protein
LRKRGTLYGVPLIVIDNGASWVVRKSKQISYEAVFQVLLHVPVE